MAGQCIEGEGKMYVLKKIWALIVIKGSLFLGFLAQADYYDVGLRDIRFQEFNFYNVNTETGKHIQSLYTKYEALKKIDFYHLPDDFDPIIDEVYEYIQKNSNQYKGPSESDPNGFYVGLNGVRNGKGFTFDKKELPTKIVRLAFCFGLDPIVYTGLLNQESKFSTNALSPTKASGFSQLTTIAIVEVSEQLGLLGPAYASDGAEEALNQYINCYYKGYDKKWVNMWEDGTIPAGKEAYRGGNIGDGRSWLYVSGSKAWLNEDPDRNLVYGAAYFKAMLNRSGIGGNYYRALARYNVAEQQVYTSKIRRYYNDLSPGVSSRINARGGFQRIHLENLEFDLSGFGENRESYRCRVPVNDGSLQAFEMLKEFYSENDLLKGVMSHWLESNFCDNKLISL